jgi:acyl dehydratase
VNTDAVGKTYSATVYEVGRQKVVEFAGAIGETNAIYLDRASALAAGYPEQVAPFTFPTVIMNISDQQLIADHTLGIDWERVVDGEEEISYERPIYVNDVLRATPTIVDMRSKGPLDFLTFRTDVVDATSEDAVCSVLATLIARDGGGA